MAELYYIGEIKEMDGKFFVGDVFDREAYYSVTDAKEYLCGIYGEEGDVWVLGEDELPEEVLDIRGMLQSDKDAPAAVIAVRGPSGKIRYRGLFPVDRPWYRVCGIKKSEHGDAYETFQSEWLPQAPVDLADFLLEFPDGCVVYILGQDKLPDDVDDIRGRVENEPDVIIAVKSFDGDVWYQGLNQINK
jgi:hypothetical protein